MAESKTLIMRTFEALAKPRIWASIMAIALLACSVFVAAWALRMSAFQQVVDAERARADANRQDVLVEMLRKDNREIFTRLTEIEKRLRPEKRNEF